MRKIVVFSFLWISFAGFSQEIQFTKTGHIWFFSGTPIEDIEAHNHKVICAFDKTNNVLEFKLKIKDFVFEKSLMQEHFNENYMESDLYEYATFKGSIDNLTNLPITSNGTYPASVSGKLTIHGVTRDVKIAGEAIKQENGLTFKAHFEVSPADYKIEIPKIVIKNIAEIIQVHVDVNVNAISKPK